MYEHSSRMYVMCVTHICVVNLCFKHVYLDENSGLVQWYPHGNRMNEIKMAIPEHFPPPFFIK